jgi:hypothetical protein
MTRTPKRPRHGVLALQDRRRTGSVCRRGVGGLRVCHPGQAGHGESDADQGFCY